MYKTFKEFYPFYLSQHSKPATRLLHMIGLIVAFSWLISSLWLSAGYYTLLAIPAGYLFSWIGHFFIEHNRPATLTYPLFSLCGDFKLFFDIIKHRKILFEK